MKYLAALAFYIVLILCYTALLAEIPLTIFIQYLTYFIIEPKNCHNPTGNLFISLYSGVCEHKSVHWGSYDFVHSSRCFPPDWRNWTRIDEVNKALGVSTNLVEGGKSLNTARYVSFAASVSSFLLFNALSYGVIFETLFGFCFVNTLIGFLLGSSLILSIWSFFLIQSSDQVRGTSWTTYFTSCEEIHVSIGAAYHLNIASITIFGVISIVPFSIIVLIWFFPDFKLIPFRELFHNNVLLAETPQVPVDEVNFDFCDIFPNAGQQRSLELVNVHRYRTQTQRTRNPNPNERPRHPNFQMDSMSAAESFIDNSNFYEVFGEGYTPIPQTFFASDRIHMEQNEPQLTANATNAAKDGINNSSKSTTNRQSFQDAALARSAHFVGLLHHDYDPYNNFQLKPSCPIPSIVDDIG
jgi:hypothetical protein